MVRLSYKKEQKAGKSAAEYSIMFRIFGEFHK